MPTDIVLLKDIVIPKGTVLSPAPLKTERGGNQHFQCVVGLDPNSCGYFEYCLDDMSKAALAEYFTTLK